MSNSPMCYYPDGTESGDTPCHSPSIGGPSACCNPAHICLDNHLCLHTNGPELIARGSCTDRTWESLQCPVYCSDVNPSYAIGISFVQVDGKPLFCCGNMNPFNNTCLSSTKGSHAPFFIEAGLVIQNRTSGSTNPNSTDTATVIVTTTTTAAPVILKSTVTTTVTAKATTTASSLPTCPMRSPSPSPRKDTAIAAGVSSLLGLGLLITLGLLWKQKKQKQSLRKDLQEWEKKYVESMKAKTEDQPSWATATVSA